MIDGIEVKVGEATLTAAPLNLAATKKLLPKVQAMSETTDPVEAIDVSMGVVLAALRRNHPDVTTEQIEEAFSFGDLLELSTQILQMSGFVGGNRRATAQPDLSTGTPSTES